MKATGEVMAIAPTLEAGIMKAVRSLEENIEYLKLDRLDEYEKTDLEEERRLFFVGITRAKRSLTLVCGRKQSPFLRSLLKEIEVVSVKGSSTVQAKQISFLF